VQYKRERWANAPSSVTKRRSGNAAAQGYKQKGTVTLRKRLIRPALGQVAKTHNENKPFMLCSWFLQNIVPIYVGSDQGVVQQYKRERWANARGASVCVCLSVIKRCVYVTILSNNWMS
jgi:hypothetical protein